jgi:hypothetical protein
LQPTPACQVEYYIPFFSPNGSEIGCCESMGYWCHVVTLLFQSSNKSFRLFTIILLVLILLVIVIAFYHNPGAMLALQAMILSMVPNLSCYHLGFMNNENKAQRWSITYPKSQSQQGSGSTGSKILVSILKLLLSK